MIDNRYAAWRAQRVAQTCLHEPGTPNWPAERLLQQIWKLQRILRPELQTHDHLPVRVLHPGFWNHEPGPDFREAIIQIGSQPPRTGDIEIDLSPQGWKQHGHWNNPAYSKVILHVVWDGSASPVAKIPTMALENRLDAPLEQLRSDLGGETADRVAPASAGQCSAPLKGLAVETLLALLRQAAEVRLSIKGGALQAQARHNGWNQALWEGLFAALGYKHNSWPMRRIAELLPCLGPHGRKETMQPLTWQARLLGVANLLPTDLTREQVNTDEYLKRVWELWWREQDHFREYTLPRSLWKFGGLRPANHPQRRLALASHWLAEQGLPERLEAWAAKSISTPDLAPSLADCLPSGEDDYWCKHWTFRSKTISKPQPMLGEQRLGDLAINVILPWLWVRALAGRNAAIRQTIQERYFHWPATEDNAVLKLARQRLLGGVTHRNLFKTAAAQQGLLQITRDFCDHSNSACENCPFPELVKGIA